MKPKIYGCCALCGHDFVNLGEIPIRHLACETSLKAMQDFKTKQRSLSNERAKPLQKLR